MHGGLQIYRGAASAARSYVEADRSRADDYYLAEGSGLAEHYAASRDPDGLASVRHLGSLNGDDYEQWVAGHHLATGPANARSRAWQDIERYGLQHAYRQVGATEEARRGSTYHPSAQSPRGGPSR